MDRGSAELFNIEAQAEQSNTCWWRLVLRLWLVGGPLLGKWATEVLLWGCVRGRLHSCGGILLGRRVGRLAWLAFRCVLLCHVPAAALEHALAKLGLRPNQSMGMEGSARIILCHDGPLKLDADADANLFIA